MFVICLKGGTYDGQRIDKFGEVSFGTKSPLKFDDLSDAQQFIEDNQCRVVSDFGNCDFMLIENW